MLYFWINQQQKQHLYIIDAWIFRDWCYCQFVVLKFILSIFNIQNQKGGFRNGSCLIFRIIIFRGLDSWLKSCFMCSICIWKLLLRPCNRRSEELSSWGDTGNPEAVKTKPVNQRDCRNSGSGGAIRGIVYMINKTPLHETEPASNTVLESEEKTAWKQIVEGLLKGGSCSWMWKNNSRVQKLDHCPVSWVLRHRTDGRPFASVWTLYIHNEKEPQIITPPPLCLTVGELLLLLVTKHGASLQGINGINLNSRLSTEHCSKSAVCFVLLFFFYRCCFANLSALSFRLFFFDTIQGGFLGLFPEKFLNQQVL